MFDTHPGQKKLFLRNIDLELRFRLFVYIRKSVFWDFAQTDLVPDPMRLEVSKEPSQGSRPEFQNGPLLEIWKV